MKISLTEKSSMKQKVDGLLEWLDIEGETSSDKIANAIKSYWETWELIDITKSHNVFCNNSISIIKRLMNKWSITQDHVEKLLSHSKLKWTIEKAIDYWVVDGISDDRVTIEYFDDTGKRTCEETYEHHKQLDWSKLWDKIIRTSFLSTKKYMRHGHEMQDTLVELIRRWDHEMSFNNHVEKMWFTAPTDDEINEIFESKEFWW